MTKSRWEDLPPKGRWDIQVAMRGPDCQHSELIKWFSTSVLRWAMHSVIRVGGTLNDDLKLIIVPNDCYTLDRDIRNKMGERALSWSAAHFFQHAVEAANWLEIGAHTIPTDTYLKAIKQGSTQVAAVIMWEWANKQRGYEKLTAELGRHLEDSFGIGPTKFDLVKKGVED